MILSAGLTPAWQQILVLDSFRLGEVNRARTVHWCASGKVFNSGIAARHLGGPSRTLATAGGPLLEQIERELGDMGVPVRFVVTEAPTRVCTTILDRGTGTITELVENGRPLVEHDLDRFRDAYAEEAAGADVAVISGSLPAGTPASFYRELLERTPCPAVLDFRGEGLLGCLDLEPLAVKPNREELARTAGRPLKTGEDLLEAMRELNRRGARWVVITQGAGPVWVTSAAETYRLDPPPVEQVVNPIGCGDALAAGIAWATRDGREPVEAVRFGIAAASESLGQLLPGRVELKKVRARAREVGLKQL